jgi:hypothetical protein
MDFIVKAPWTMDQVRLLWKYQMAGHFHPYTCGHREDHPEIGSDKGMLVPTRKGWICPMCDYTQDWAHAHSFIDPDDSTTRAAYPSAQNKAWTVRGILEPSRDWYEARVVAPTAPIALLYAWRTTPMPEGQHLVNVTIRQVGEPE